MEQNPIEELLASVYPNPERIGCPGEAALLNLAEHPLPMDDAVAVHIWHCSPCFEEFRVLRDQRRERKSRLLKRKMVTATAAAVCGVFVLAVSVSLPLRNLLFHWHTASQEDGALDFSDRGVGRGDTSGADNMPQILSAAARVLVAKLPPGSEAGGYELEIRSEADMTTVIEQARGIAAAEADGWMRLRCNLAPRQLPTGSYIAAWRPTGKMLWHYSAFVVR